jgi:hypothetical protein
MRTPRSIRAARVRPAASAGSTEASGNAKTPRSRWKPEIAMQGERVVRRPLVGVALRMRAVGREVVEPELGGAAAHRRASLPE